MFQSLFYWNLLSYDLIFSGSSSPSKFQSLFYWNLLSYHLAKGYGLGQCNVSILVLLEPPLIPKRWFFRREWIGKFQSLFYWNLLSYYSRDKLELQTSEVSILVLLEPPLIHGVGVVEGRGWGWVSILVLLEPPLIQRLSGLILGKRWCFNPCFTGTSSHTIGLATWSILRFCFNPCFTGTSSHTGPGCISNWELILFQSLFYWNLLSYCRPRRDSHLHLQVSILVLLEPPLIRQRLFVCLPCGARVSILVLLEPPLIRQTKSNLRRPCGSFNPCFTGTSSHTWFWQKFCWYI